MTPMLAAPLGISTPAHVVTSGSALEIADALSSVYGPSVSNLSEIGGGGASERTVSDSMGIMSNSSRSWVAFPAFRIQADVWVELAEFFMQLERISDTQACVEEACSLYPHSHHALYLRGRLFSIRAGRAIKEPALCRRLREEAKSCFLGAIALLPTYIPALTHLSKCYQLEGVIGMAEKTLRDAISVDPLDYRCWHELGLIAAQQGRVEEASECFQTASSLDLNTPLIPFSTIPRIISWL